MKSSTSHVVILFAMLCTTAATPSAGAGAGAAAVLVPRSVHISGKQFVLTETKQPVVMHGPNVVVKGPPYLPSVEGNTVCQDNVNSACSAHGNCTSCTTFNAADIAHIKSLGWNAIRLGVVWAGGMSMGVWGKPVLT